MNVARRLVGAFFAISSLAVPVEAQGVPPPPAVTPWHWQNPLPHGNSMNAVACPGTTCYAVGSATTAVSPAPGRWDAHFDRRLGVLSALACPDDLTCYAISNDGTSLGAILGTIDGARTWTRLRAPGTSLTSISCPNTRTCYATGQYAGRVIVTRDAGHTWSATPITFRPVDLSCPTTTVCYAPIDTSLIHSPPPGIAVSVDGGRSWKLRAVGLQGQLWTIRCVAAGTCYVIAFAGSDLGTPYLLVTRNAGGSWQRQVFPRNTYFRGGSLTCPTTTTCYLAGDNGTPPGILLATNNAGKSWVSRRWTAGRPTALACRDRLRCAAVGAGNEVERTANGWVSWTQETYNAVRTAGNPRGQYTLRAVACPSAGTCYAAGDATTFLTTSSAGEQWHNRSGALARKAAGFNVSALACPTATTCFAGGLAQYPPGSGSRVYATHDGGKSWSANPGKGFAVVTCPTPSICYAGGEKGAFRVSHDGGRSWTAERTPLAGKQYTILAIACPTTVRCVAGAIGPSESPPHPSSNLGALLSTADGGRTWTRADTDPYPTTLACRTAGDCFALSATSYNSHNLVTRDAGRTWQRYDGLPPGAWLALTCADSSSCYAAGAAGAIAVTRDGGAGWQVEELPTFNSLYGIACTARETCHAVGLFGTILSQSERGQGSVVP